MYGSPPPRSILAFPTVTSLCSKGRGLMMTRSGVLAVFVEIVLLSGMCFGQEATGTPPFGSFGGGPDTVNLGNLNAHISIPVVHKTGRGMPFSYDLSYDSS